MAFKLKNFSIYRFNRDVNNSVPDDAYMRWSAYRRDIAAFIDRTGPRGSVIVFGAGALNDVDLPYLCETFGEVVLTDADVKSIGEGIARQGIGDVPREKIEIVQCDYTGAAAFGLFEKLESLAKDAVPADAIAAYIGEAFHMMHGGEELRDRRFDFVYACPVYTQLVYTQIEVFLKILYEYGLYPYDELNRIITAAHHHMQYLLGNYNDLMLSVLKDGGRIMVLTDIMEMARGGGMCREVERLLEDGDTAGLERRIRDEGLDFGIAGRDDLLLKIDLIDAFHMLWPFNENKEYLIQGILGQK